ncbi:MAG: phytanoyl-CoA dioxygenase family protein [Pseudomonadota bacterium]
MLPTPFNTNGFAFVPGIISADECKTIEQALSGALRDSAGTRNLLSLSWCKALASKIGQHQLISSVLPADFVVVQCTFFEKSVSKNWLVPLHQDLSIPVAERVPDPGLKGWSEKEGQLYVQAPLELLQQLLAVRLHIDDCGADDGPLQVLPGSHLHGQIGAEAAVAPRLTQNRITCIAGQGEAMLMRPLLLHSSSRSTGSSKRRVLHFLFGPGELPSGLRWPHLQSEAVTV